MSKKIKEEINDLDEMIDLESEFNIKEDDIKHLLQTNQLANKKKLKYHLKELDEGIDKVEDGLFDILYVIDNIIERYEDGNLFDQECGEALKTLCIITDFTKKLEKDFNDLKTLKDEI